MPNNLIFEWICVLVLLVFPETTFCIPGNMQKKILLKE